MSKKKKNTSPEENNEEVAAETTATSEDTVDGVVEEVAPAEAEKADNEKYLRLAAEYDNYRKRAVRERETLFSDVRADTVSKFLPVYDNLCRALAQETADEAYKRGVEMTCDQLCEVFKSLGVTEIEAVGKTFDPELHNAVMHIDDENYGENEIVAEFQKGFKIGEKVIRFSMVQVAN